MDRLPDIYLASQSPRRRELLRQIGVRFEVVGAAVDESPAGAEAPLEHVRRLALEKARAGRLHPAADPALPVLGADTIVVNGAQVLGKPRDREHAVRMLLGLSDRTHEVISAVALCGRDESVSVSISRVTFRALSPAECEAYWDSGEPADKAGAYAIQGLAAIFVSRLEGSYSGVMGLPLFETARLLTDAGVPLLRSRAGAA